MLFLTADLPAPAGREAAALDEGLLPRVGQGDAGAFEALYRRAERPVYALALSLLKNPDDAQDVVQDVFLKVRAAAHLYVPQGKPMAWIFTITKNLCRSRLRGRDRETTIPEGEDRRFSYVSDPTDRLVLEGAMAILSVEERQAVLLHALSGLKHREIARDLGQPISTVLSRYHRAIQKLRRYLAEGGDGG